MPNYPILKHPTTDPCVVELCGIVSQTVLDLVAPGLKNSWNENLLWYHLQSMPPDTKIGNTFEWAFDVAPLGGVVPIAQSQFVLRDLITAPGNFYDLPFYRDNQAFRKIWGWRPIGLIEFTNGIPVEFQDYPHDRWQAGHNCCFLGNTQVFEQAKSAAPEPELEFLQDFLELLNSWKGASNHVSHIEVGVVPSLAPTSYWQYKPTWNFVFREISGQNWNSLLRESCTHTFGLNTLQVDQLWNYLERFWREPPSNVWRVRVDTSGGGFYAIEHDDFIFQVNGILYWLHLGWSD